MARLEQVLPAVAGVAIVSGACAAVALGCKLAYESLVSSFLRLLRLQPF